MSLTNVVNKNNDLMLTCEISYCNKKVLGANWTANNANSNTDCFRCVQYAYSIIRGPADWLEDFMNYSSFSDPAQTESRLLENVHHLHRLSQGFLRMSINIQGSYTSTKTKFKAFSRP